MSELINRITAVLRDGMTDQGLFFRNAHIGDVAPLAERVAAELQLTEEATHSNVYGELIEERRWVSKWSEVTPSAAQHRTHGGTAQSRQIGGMP